GGPRVVRGPVPRSDGSRPGGLPGVDGLDGHVALVGTFPADDPASTGRGADPEQLEVLVRAPQRRGPAGDRHAGPAADARARRRPWRGAAGVGSPELKLVNCAP